MLYIYNQNNLANIACKEKIQKAEKTAFSVVKGLCERELFSYDSRIKLTKLYLNINTKVPIYINKEILLMPTKSPKRYETYWINYFEVFSYQKHFDKTLILFTNLKELEVSATVNSFTIMMDKAKRVKEYMDKRGLNSSI